MRQITQEQVAECYQPLFDLMSKEHNKLLLISELDEIISASLQVLAATGKLYERKCDVEGCDSESSSGGAGWGKTGYWMLCSKHFANFINGENQLVMKKEAIEREKNRQPDGCLPA